eukprot:2469788-Alexandrium_andersonii.AAC.1
MFEPTGHRREGFSRRGSGRPNPIASGAAGCDSAATRRSIRSSRAGTSNELSWGRGGRRGKR